MGRAGGHRSRPAAPGVVMHFRSTIRDELVSRASNLPGQSSSPFDSRELAVHEPELPASIVVFDIEAATPGPLVAEMLRQSDRVLTASIIVCSTSASELDELAAEIEKRMGPDLAPGVQHKLDATRFEDPKQGERDFFSASLDYEISYSLIDGSPDRQA